ncbi:MAG: CRISPR-associated helicase Cas3' [Bacteroidetes bacterium]|nr:CRISPR-associated helicase Cas3' [Bacteroidota bacterium]
MAELPPWRYFWAKSNRGTGLPETWSHPLWAHLLDVGACAERLWHDWLAPDVRAQLAASLERDDDEAGRFVAFAVALHDAGKATPGFFYQAPDLAAHLTAAGFALARPSTVQAEPHNALSVSVARRWIAAERARAEMEETDAVTGWEALAVVTGVHHGGVLNRMLTQRWTEQSDGPLGLGDWRAAQLELVDAVRAVLWPEPLPRWALEPMRRWPSAWLALAGFTTLADWLGSSHAPFHEGMKPVSLDADLREYFDTRARAGAGRSMEAAALVRTPRLAWRGWEHHFPFDPRPLQACAAAQPVPEAPTLTVVEAPTGEGKTEAAFALVARRGGGAYLALPTMATADAQWKRFGAFLQTALPDGASAALRLVHGRDLLRSDALALVEATRRGVGNEPDDRRETGQGSAEALAWMQPRKKALLAPFGVGTVDQALLAALKVRHFFLRHLALAGKTVVFDEVHAYDTYMSTLFERLLAWLREAGAHVVVLSATLPSGTRARLFEAWGATNLEEDPSPAPYPAVWTAVAGGAVECTPVEADEERASVLAVETMDDAPERIAARAAEAARHGAAVLVVCNTVPRAQAVFRALEGVDRHLMHARYPADHRRRQADLATSRFGKGRPVGQGAVLVGTQVVEQSLDLDTDLVISDLAPVDLLLQRAGRGHRHARVRPAGYERPRLVVAVGAVGDGGVPNVEAVSAHGYVYARALLWRTVAQVVRGNGWPLPGGDGERPGFRALVEAVYGPQRLPLTTLYPDAEAKALQKAEDEETNADTRQAQRGAFYRIADPKALRDLLGTVGHDVPQVADHDDLTHDLPLDDAPGSTRDAAPADEFVVLHEHADGAWRTHPAASSPLYPLAPEGTSSVAFRQSALCPALGADDLRAVLGATLRLRRDRHTEQVRAAHAEAWKAIAAAKARAVSHLCPLVLDAEGRAIAYPMLRLDPVLGLVLDQTGARKP